MEMSNIKHNMKTKLSMKMVFKKRKRLIQCFQEIQTLLSICKKLKATKTSLSKKRSYLNLKREFK